VITIFPDKIPALFVNNKLGLIWSLAKDQQLSLIIQSASYEEQMFYNIDTWWKVAADQILVLQHEDK